MNPDSLNCTNEGFFSSLSEKLCLITTVSIIWPGLMRKNVAQPGPAPKQFLREEKIANSFYFLCSRNFSEAIFIWCTALLYAWCRRDKWQTGKMPDLYSIYCFLSIVWTQIKTCDESPICNQFVLLPSIYSCEVNCELIKEFLLWLYKFKHSGYNSFWAFDGVWRQILTRWKPSGSVIFTRKEARLAASQFWPK